MFKYAILIPAVLLLTFNTANADQDNRFLIDGATTVDEAVEIISEELESQGITIVTTVNHASAAASVGLELRPTTVIFARDEFLESSFLRRSRIAALDLPLKFLVFEDQNGNIKLEFNDEGFIADRHHIRYHDRLLQQADSFLNQFGQLDYGILKVASNLSVDDTVDSLFAILEERGFRIPIPGGIGFKHTPGESSQTRLIVFGNPNVGTPLMQNDQSIGRDLPQKFLVYENDNDQVVIAFNDPAFLARKHNLQRDADPELETRLQNITNALMIIAETAANP